MSRVETGTRQSDERAGLRSAAVFGLALAWLLAFGWYFFAQELPNNPQFSRSAILFQTPELLLEHVAAAERAPGMESGWRYLPQRFDLLGVALLIWGSAWGLGRLVLRLLGVTRVFSASGRHALAMGLGLAGWSLITLGMGLGGLLERRLFLILLASSLLGEVAAGLWARHRSPAAEGDRENSLPRQREMIGSGRIAAVVMIAVTPFLLAMLLGAMLPPAVDFDEKEYHLQGPKEWYLQGEISFLPHNVYTNFPFLTEMLTLLAMVVRGDWYRGGMAGRTVLMGFAPLTALALYAGTVIAVSGRTTEGGVAEASPEKKRFASTAGWLAVLVFLTTPWVHRISVIAYAEGGLTFYLFATFLCVICLSRRPGGGPSGERGLLILTGFMAGSAMACKYPGVLSVVIPVGAFIVCLAMRRRGGRGDSNRWRATLIAGGLYGLGVLVAFGPWAIKNIAQTGNPVYPLLYGVFGGEDWDDELNAKWKSGHSPPLHLLEDPSQIVPDFALNAVSVAVRSDWQSPLVFGGAVLSLVLLWRREWNCSGLRRVWVGATLYALWLYFTWWLCTHRIDRFWVPMLPVLCLLSGLGLAGVIGSSGQVWSRSGAPWLPVARLMFGGLLAMAIAYNLAFATSRLTGYNAFLLEETRARQLATTRSIDLVNRSVAGGSRVLLVGEAEVFDAEFEPIYNTVFDRSIFEDLCTDDGGRVLSSDEIGSRLREAGIGYVFVNWLEVLRYREPGSYGYTEFVTPERFERLVEGGVLNEDSLSVRETTVFVDRLSTGKQQEIGRWGGGLRTTLNGRRAIRVYALYEVAGDE